MKNFLKKIFERKPVDEYLAEITETQIRILKNGEVHQKVEISDVIAIQIVTNDKGPFFEDMWFMFQTSENDGLVVPSEIEGNKAIADYVIDLEGVDKEKFIDAMSSTSNQTFEIWERSDG